MKHVILWKWNPGPGVERHYTAKHVNVLSRAIKDNATDVRVVCVTDDPAGISECETFPLWADCNRLLNPSGAHLPSCFRRLRLYDWATQSQMGMKKGERVIGLDLDALVTGDLNQIFNTPGRYVGWLLPGGQHEEVYNGSFQMFNAGDLRFIWDQFNPQRSPTEAMLMGYRGSDQAWLSWKLVGQEGSKTVGYPVVASYPLHCRRLGVFSKQTRLVFFHGKHKPWAHETQAKSHWIKRYWKEEPCFT